MASNGLLTQKELDALKGIFASHGIPVKAQGADEVPVPTAADRTAQRLQHCAQAWARQWQAALTVTLFRPTQIKLRSIRRRAKFLQKNNQYAYTIGTPAAPVLHLFCMEPLINLVNETCLGARPDRAPEVHPLTALDRQLFERNGRFLAEAFTPRPGAASAFRSDETCTELDDVLAIQYDVEIVPLLRTSIIVVASEKAAAAVCRA